MATNRMLSFVEFLSDEYDISVFCLGEKKERQTFNEEVPVFYSPQNKLNTLVKHSPMDNALVHKMKTAGNILLASFLNKPLQKWQQGAFKDLVAEHKKNPFQAVISSHAPHEAHVVAIDFKKEFPDIPWIADMRDEMSLNPGLNEAQKKHLTEIEGLVNTYASALTTVSLPILNDFKSNCPDILHFVEVRNGFNHDFVNNKKEKGKTFKLGYFGTFYGERKPTYFFQALEELKKEGKCPDFDIELFGVHKNITIPNTLKDNVHFNDSLPYAQAIEKMSEMSANLLLLPKLKQKGVYSGKVFDYLSVQVPILACVDSMDVAAELIDEMNAGHIAEFDSVEENKKAILHMFSDWEKEVIRAANDEQVATLHRKNQVLKLKNVLDKILEK